MRRVNASAVLSCLLLVAGCSSAQDVNDAVGTDEGTATPSPTASADGGARAIKVENDLYSFSFDYPRRAGAIPRLKAQLDARARKLQQQLGRDAQAARRDARENGFPFNPYFSGTHYRVTGETRNLLSLAATTSSYSGGAHGMSGLDPLIWDKGSERPLGSKALFASPQAIWSAIGTRYCERLDAARAKKREGMEWGASAPDDSFTMCPGIDQLEIVPQNDGRGPFTRLLIYAAPYVAGPYAEGSYEIEIGVNEAVRQAVRPEFQRSFGGASARR